MPKQNLVFTTPISRLVKGHPMTISQIKDNKTNAVKLNAEGQPRTEVYFAIAVPKGQEQDFKSTDWGKMILAAAQGGYPNGEYNAPTFAWKVVDGDSAVPNRKGKKPCEQEGFKGHWVIHLKTELITNVKCFHVGKYNPIEQIQNINEIKRGDYVRVRIEVTDNAPSESPGVYINPTLVELSRAGELIQGEGPDAAEAFGTPEQKYGAVSAPPGAPASASGPRMSPTATTTYDEYIKAGWSDDQMRTAGFLLPDVVATPPAPPAAPVTPPPPAAPIVPARDLLPPPPGPRMSPTATASYEAYKSSGWTDDQMRTAGYLL